MKHFKSKIEFCFDFKQKSLWRANKNLIWSMTGVFLVRVLWGGFVNRTFYETSMENTDRTHFVEESTTRACHLDFFLVLMENTGACCLQNNQSQYQSFSNWLKFSNSSLNDFIQELKLIVPNSCSDWNFFFFHF